MTDDVISTKGEVVKSGGLLWFLQFFLFSFYHGWGKVKNNVKLMKKRERLNQNYLIFVQNEHGRDKNCI
jgi:hypothetical protein